MLTLMDAILATTGGYRKNVKNKQRTKKNILRANRENDDKAHSIGVPMKRQ